MLSSLEDEYIQLIQQHEGILHKVINLYVDNAHDKEDLFQEVLLQAWKSYSSFKGKSAFSTWLYRVCLNTVMTFQRKETRKTDQTETWKQNPKDVQPDMENHELLYFLVKQLEKVDRMLMTLHLDGYKNKEIAEITGMTQNHVNVKIHRVKKQIISAFKKIEHGHH